MQLALQKQSIQGNQEAGFTLVEIAVVLLIFAIVTLPLLSLYSEYKMAQKRVVTYERINNAATQIRIYRPSTFAYPCPADRALSPNDAMYGFENCAAFTALAINTCTANGGMCKVEGSRDADGNGAKDPVLIGALPFRTLDAINRKGFSIESHLDGWGNKLTYAVSARHTNFVSPRNSIAVGNDFKYGVITALDEHGKSTAGIGMYDLDNADGDNDPATGRDGDAQFTIISHGPSARGAYSIQGIRVATCDTAAIDGENCDNDSVFRSALGDYNANTASFYDDIAIFYKDQAGDLWGYIENPQVGGSTGHIRKLNLGRVGVNTANTPVQAQLDVNGTVRAPATLIPQVGGDLCKTDGTACLPVRYLYDGLSGANIGTASDASKIWTNTCPADYVITGISNGQVQCQQKVTVPAPPSAVDVDCPASTYIQGILTNGCIICTDGNLYPSAAACN